MIIEIEKQTTKTKIVCQESNQGTLVMLGILEVHYIWINTGGILKPF